jgi:hypothetical protein
MVAYLAFGFRTLAKRQRWRSPKIANFRHVGLDDDGRPLAMTVCCHNSSTFDRGLLHHFEHAVL